MGNGSSSGSPEEIERVRAWILNLDQENEGLRSWNLDLMKEKEGLQTRILNLVKEKEGLQTSLVNSVKENVGLLKEVDKLKIEKEGFHEKILDQLKNTKVFQTEVQKLTVENKDLKDNLMQQVEHSNALEMEVQKLGIEKEGLMETIQQMRHQKYTNGLVETIPRKSLWQQVKDINVYLKVAVVAIPISLLGLYAIKKYLERNREKSDGSGTHSWRKVHQTLTEDSEIKEDFLQTISEIWPRNDTTFNILLLGQAGSGKSSFVNACFTALLQEGRVIERAAVGRMEGDSMTLRLIPYRLKIKLDAENKDLPVQLFDLRGLFTEDKGVQTEDIKKICKGFIRARYLIDPAEGIKSGDKKYREDPQEKDRMHCIVYVLAADEVGFVHEEVEKQLKKIKKLFREDTPQLILLTKIDRIGISDVTQIFRDKRVKECCENAASFLDFCVNNVFPQSNYSDEVIPCSNKDLITLFNIKTLMERANDRMNETVLSDDDSIQN